MNEYDQEIAILGYKARSKPMEKPVQKWMDPLNKIIWRNAVKKKQKEVQIRDGRIFKLDYSSRPGKVWIEPVGGEKIPCGWFDIKRILEQEWLEVN